jgi:hypothetical protein
MRDVPELLCQAGAFVFLLLGLAHGRFEPTKLSKSRIKRLRGLDQPQYRLRVGEMRVFYDVTETEVHVLAIVSKGEAQAWLDEQGIPTPSGGSGQGEG